MPHKRLSDAARLRTLPFRMEQHCANTNAIVAFLQTRPEVTSVRYGGFGALLGFALAEGLEPEWFRHQLQLCRPWGSLGDVETLVAAPPPTPPPPFRPPTSVLPLG